MPTTAEIAGLPAFFEKLCNVFENVWLIHCTVEDARLKVGIMVAASGVENEWHLFTDGAGRDLYVQLPPEILEQGVGHKAWNLSLPWRPITRT